MDTKVVIAVTRNGLGDWYLFDAFEEADQHPLIQYGDVIMTQPSDILRKFTRLEIPWLLDKLDMGHLPQDRETLERNAEKMWARMTGQCSRPPEDPAEICALVRRDRRLSLIERKREMAETKTAAAGEENKTEKPKKPVHRKYPGSAKITLLADKDGNPYGQKNNPKREGSKSHGRFAIYVNGMTVDEFVSKGGLYADIVHDVEKGFISVK